MRLPGSLLRLSRLLLLLSVLLFGVCTAAMADGDALPRPPALEPAVQFWIRVYTEITTDAGFIHDQYNLSVVYETLHFPADMGSRAREQQVDAERLRLHDLLLRLAHGAAPQNAAQARVLALWGTAGTPQRLAEAAEDVRFQLGQADRFRAGLIRAGAWKQHIAEVLAHLGLPPELAALPHVESSFNPAAYSKVGAAGLWQFLRSTGRRFLHINGSVDERLDPFRETEAAAQLLAYNYRLLGSWPLAITAYNHGAAGMLRAREELGTDDIVRIVRDYHSPSFGFASRNFYVSFLAALTVSQHPEKYFGRLPLDPQIDFHEVRMPARANAALLARTLGIDRDTLQRLNPALRPAVWRGRQPVPAGYLLRLPAIASGWNAGLLAQRLRTPQALTVAAATSATGAPNSGAGLAAAVGIGGTGTAHAARRPALLALASPSVNVLQLSDAPAPAVASTLLLEGSGTGQYYLVQPQDTAGAIADRTGVPLGRLLALNSLPDQDFLYAGERLRLASTVSEPGVVPTPELQALADQAMRDSSDEQQALVLARQLATAEPVSAAQAQAEGPQLVPDITGPQSADAVDYSVAGDDSIRVVAAETLGHYAEWLDTSAAHLRSLNHLRGRTPVLMGRRLELDFTHASRAQFEQRRRQYHESLEAAYFAMHRIAGTQIYVTRRGDSLWYIRKHNAAVPVWLLQQYNPDLDFGTLRPGTQVSLPVVEDVAAL